MTKACALGMRAGERAGAMCTAWSYSLNRLLAEMWTAMASGPAIDEQYDARWGSDRSTPVSGSTSVSTPLNAGNEELDPNDLAPMSSGAAVRPPQTNQWKEWDDLDDDEF